MKELIVLLIIIGLIYLVSRKKRRSDSSFRGRKNNLYVGKKWEDSIGDILGFYGLKERSPNGGYCVVYADGHYNSDRWENGNIALLKGGTVLFKKKIQRPNDCHVSDDGIVLCCDWENSNALTGRFLIFDSVGKEHFAKKVTANLGACVISSDSKTAIFETFRSETEDSNKFFIVDIKQGRIVSKFQRPYSFKTAEIDIEKGSIKLKDQQGFIFEIDFDGNQVNRRDYEGQILQKALLTASSGFMRTNRTN
jgi:sugar lactone lactonase YvrE